MGTSEETFAPGLEGVIVAETRLSQVDGARGRLVGLALGDLGILG